VVNVQGKGCYVLQQDAQMRREDTLRRVEHGLNEAIDAAKSGGIGQAEVVEILGVLYEEDGL
jgi:GntR family transcriptional regulator